MPDNNNSIVSGDDLLGGFQDTDIDSPAGVDTQIVDDPILASIDAVFGTEDPDESSSNGAQRKQGRRPSSQSDGITIEDGDPFPSNKNMPKDPEALLRKLQSERDKAVADVQKYQQEVTKYKSYEEFLASIQEDPEVRHAFISQLEPELVKPKNPLTFVQERLKKEFGDDFDPKADGVNPLQVQLYNERAREIYGEWKQKQNSLPANLKDLTERRKAARQAQLAEAQAEKQKIMSELKWDDSKFEQFSQWIPKVRGIHMAKIWEKIQSQVSQKNAPFAANQSGGRPLTPSLMMTQLDNMFGAN